MYNLNSLLIILNDESTGLLCIYAIAITAIIYMATKKVKIKKEKIKKDEVEISVKDYTLHFENDLMLNNLPNKKISIITKVVLMAFVIVFVVTPFNELIFTLESAVNHSFQNFSWSCFG